MTTTFTGPLGARSRFRSALSVTAPISFLCVVLFDLPAQNGHFMSLYKRLSDSLCSCKDRAFSGTSAKLEEKNLLRLAQRELGETNKLHTEGISVSGGSPMTPLIGSTSRCTAQAFLQAGA